MIRIAPDELDQPRRPIACGGAADGMDHRIMLGEVVILDDRHLGAMRAARRRDRIGQLLGPHVAGRRIDQIAHQSGRACQCRRLVDPRRIRGKQHAGTCRLGLLAITVEAVLREEPAERRVARSAFGQAIGALGQAADNVGELPRIGLILVHADGDAPALGGIVRQDDMAAGLALEPGGGDDGAGPRWLGLEPIVEPRFGDADEGGGGLAAIGGEQGRKFGHRVGVPDFAASRQGKSRQRSTKRLRLCR